MHERFHNSNPGALTLEQARALEIKRQRERRRKAEDLAAQGRGDDSEIAHVACGEIVVPEKLQTPEFLAAVRRAAKASGIPFEKLRVGSRRNNINPNTGVAEFDPQSPMPQLGSLPTYGSHIPLSPESLRELKDWTKTQGVYANRLVDRKNRHVRAWLDTLPITEGAGYNTLVGGKTFTDDSKYPGYESGAYQITGDTYKDTARQTGAKGFDPLTQDVLATQNMANKKALEPVLRGDFDGALPRMAREWASLPQKPDDTGDYNTAEGKYQKSKTYDEVKAIYERNLQKYPPYE